MSSSLSVVFFVHKLNFELFELHAMDSIFEKFSNRNISVVVPQKIKDEINKFLKKRYSVPFKLIHLDDDNFKSISSYGKLLKSIEFYRLFEKFEYILIVQLDVLIVSDSLDYWINKKFTYIGAPWIQEDTGLKSLVVGNGGLSLRKTSDFIRWFSSGNLISIPNWYYDKKKCPIILRSFINNLINLGFIHNFLRYRFFEDFYWTQMVFPNCDYALLPDGEEASTFSMEKTVPITNKENFIGYHAFQKYLNYDKWIGK